MAGGMEVKVNQLLQASGRHARFIVFVLENRNFRSACKPQDGWSFDRQDFRPLYRLVRVANW
jgi:hypothetical protein